MPVQLPMIVRSDRDKVLGIAAWPVSTEMVDLCSMRYVAILRFIAHLMRRPAV
jgi:hypothetical protein